MPPGLRTPNNVLSGASPFRLDAACLAAAVLATQPSLSSLTVLLGRESSLLCPSLLVSCFFISFHVLSWAGIVFAVLFV